jgi:glucan phosphoethanolaminetransferase (alkaline phosphatase superfamily)
MPPLPHVAQLIHSVDLSQTRPFGLIAQVVDYFNERAQLAKLTQGAQNFSFQAHQRQPDGAPEVVVMVLGESSRFDRWSLNGYARDTTPLLAKESNLLALSDVVTPVSITRQSVPIIVTRKPASAALTSGYHERSFVSAYKEAGFRTWWLSNQLTYGTHDTPVSAYSQEADHQAHLNPGGHTDQSSYDAALLEPLQRALAAPAPRKLVVLHTLGNHWNYGRRYPAQFDRWQPSLTDIDRPDLDNPAHRERASNSYDNSILYTDWFLAQVIGILKRQQQRAVLVFASDHGEVLADESCPKFLHGHGTQHELHVPAFVWYSDQYRTRYPDKIAELQRHRAERLGTPDFFHTLLDLGDIRYPGERLEWSFAQAAYTPRQRLVAAGGWADYDTAERKGTCLALAAK